VVQHAAACLAPAVAYWKSTFGAAPALVNQRKIYDAARYFDPTQAAVHFATRDSVRALGDAMRVLRSEPSVSAWGQGDDGCCLLDDVLTEHEAYMKMCATLKGHDSLSAPAASRDNVHLHCR
jgi:hypothetical protein